MNILKRIQIMASDENWTVILQFSGQSDYTEIHK